VIKEPVFDVRLPGSAHAYKIGSDAASERRKVRYHVAPQVARRGIAMEKNYWITRASLDIVHRGAVDFYMF
jgi:hypothetical protein